MCESTYDLRIEDDGKLFTRWGPGGSRFWKVEPGQYYEAHFALGGCGGGKRTPREVADRLACRMSAQLVGYFLDLGWHDVLEEMPAARYRLEAKILLEKERKAREERIRYIEELKAMVKEYEPIYEKGLHLDEKYLRGYYFDKIHMKNGHFDEEEFSARRFEWGVRAFLKNIAGFEGLKRGLQKMLEEEERTKASRTDEND